MTEPIVHRTWRTRGRIVVLHPLAATSLCDVRLCPTLVQSPGLVEAAQRRPHGTCIDKADSGKTP